MSYMLFLDDYRSVTDAYNILYKPEYLEQSWIVVRSHNEFVNYITKNGLPNLISFDHDLADEHYASEDQWHRYNDWATEQNFKEKTGFESAKWLVNYCLDNNLELPNYFVHSMNMVGRENIKAYLDNFVKFKSEQ